MDDKEGMVENSHPKIPAQIPGIELANEKDNDGDLMEVLEHSEEGEAFGYYKNDELEPYTPADIAGVDSVVDLVEVVEDPNSTFENNIYCEEYNDEKRERT